MKIYFFTFFTILKTAVWAQLPGNALVFNGINDYVDCGNDASLNINDALTLEAWIKTFTITNARIISKWGNYSGYEMAEYVTDIEIASEVARAKEMEDLIGTPDMGRTALEAQLSAILTRMRKDETRIKDLYWANLGRVGALVKDADELLSRDSRGEIVRYTNEYMTGRFGIELLDVDLKVAD